MKPKNVAIAWGGPFLFILFWSSGFPITRWGLEFAEPFTILWVRSALVVFIMCVYALFVRVAWARDAGKECINTHDKANEC